MVPDLVVWFVDGLNMVFPLGDVLIDEHIGDAASHLNPRQRPRRCRIEVGDGRRGPLGPQPLHGRLMPDSVQKEISNKIEEVAHIADSKSDFGSFIQ